MSRLDPPHPFFKGGKAVIASEAKQSPILERIASGPPLLFDGALGSRLMQMGLPAGSPPEAWALERPDLVEAVHREYVEAGSEVIATVTFGGNRLRLRKCGLENELERINRQAVEIARGVAGDSVWVAGDMGPTGEFFQPLGSLTPEIASEVYREQGLILADAGVDFFLLETFYDLKEARICLAACRTVAPQVPVAASMTFKKTRRGFFTEMGDPAAEALRALHDDGAFLVGANCTLDAEGMVELARSLMDTLQKIPPTPLNKGGINPVGAELPPFSRGAGGDKLCLLFQPNAGSPQITSDGIVYPQNAEIFAECIMQIIALGARAVGGCCGTEGKYIREIEKRMQKTGQRTQEK